MNFLKLVWHWIIYSSTNSDKISLTVKGGLATLAVVLTYYFHFIQAPVNPDQLTIAIDAIASFVQAALLALSALVTVVGVIRKLYTTATGTNAILKAL